MPDPSIGNQHGLDDERPSDDHSSDDLAVDAASALKEGGSPAVEEIDDDDYYGDFNEDDPVLPRKPMTDSADMDITPMIDIVFLLLIFFIVSSTPAKNTAVELPPARYGVGVSEKNSVVITVAKPEGSGKTAVYLADGRVGNPLPESKAEKTAAIVAAVEEGFFRQSKMQILIKAGKNVKRKEVYEVEIAASRADVEGLKIYHGVYEKN